MAVAAFFKGGLSTFYWHNEVFGFLLAPADSKLSPFDGKPIVNAPTTMFGLTLGLSVLGGKLAAFPVVFVGLLSLTKPFVPFDWWRRFIAINAIVGLLLFALGVVFVYFVMMPVSMNFLLSFGDDTVVIMVLLERYLDLIFSLFKWIGLIFMIPLFMNMLARMGWLSYPRAKGFYRVAFFLTAFFSALISPGLDPTLTVMVAVPMYSLYLVGLGAVWAVDTDAGNYLWFNSTNRLVRRVLRKIRWIAGSPARGVRWVYRKVKRGYEKVIDRWGR